MEKDAITAKNEKISKRLDEYVEEACRIRKMMVAAIYDMASKMGGFVEYYADEYDYEPLLISYDGGSHPEYASSLYCDVYSVKAVDGKTFSVELDETKSYEESRMSFDDVASIFKFVRSMYEKSVCDSESNADEN